MEKVKQRIDQAPRITSDKPKNKPTKQHPKKERCHLHGVIRDGRFYLD